MALFLLPGVIAVGLEYRGFRLDGATVSILISVALGLPLLWLAWAAYRVSRAETGVTLGDVADRLARAVGAQWEAESRIRRLNSPYPLPVSWAGADPALGDDWDVLARLATSGAGWPACADRSGWASGLEQLAGGGNELAVVLSRVPTRRLVVLGEPGSGKTILMVRLVLDLLQQRASGGAVPYLASLASWDPVGEDLSSWLVGRLIADYPALAGRAIASSGSLAEELFANLLVLPVLDGLDELPASVRARAIVRINDALRPGEPVVMTCRAQQYGETVNAPGKDGALLRAAATVQLQPLERADVTRYLIDDAPSPAASARWEPVLSALGQASPVWGVLSVPLMISLARVVYSPRSHGGADDLRDPAELAGFHDERDIENLLFDEFIPATYDLREGSRWSAAKAGKWLAFLSRSSGPEIINRAHQYDSDITWWRLPRRVRVSIEEHYLLNFSWIASIFGLAVAYVMHFGGGVNADEARLVGLAVTLCCYRFIKISISSNRTPVSRLSVKGSALWGAIFIPVVYALITVPFGTGTTGFLTAYLAVIVVSSARPFAVGSTAPDFAETATPRSLLARDRLATIFLLITGCVSAVLVFALLQLLSADHQQAVPARFVESVAVVICWTASQTAWIPYILAKTWLAATGRLPWFVMSFLDDAHQRGVLRQIGAVYQFRHIELERRIAARFKGE